jgi:hypothetical protein
VAVFLESSTARSATAVLLITLDYETTLRISNRVLLVTAEGSLQEIEFDRNQPERGVRASRDLFCSQASGVTDGANDSLAWETAAAAEDFVIQELSLSTLTLFPLGAMMVAQTSRPGLVRYQSAHPGGLVGAALREIAPLIGLLVLARVSMS